MPKNPFIYYGLLLIVGTAAIFVGAWLTQKIEFILPFTLGLGILLVILGVLMENKKKKSRQDEQDQESNSTN